MLVAVEAAIARTLYSPDWVYPLCCKLISFIKIRISQLSPLIVLCPRTKDSLRLHLINMVQTFIALFAFKLALSFNKKKAKLPPKLFAAKKVFFLITPGS